MNTRCVTTQKSEDQSSPRRKPGTSHSLCHFYTVLYSAITIAQTDLHSWLVQVIGVCHGRSQYNTLVEASWNVMAHVQKPDFVSQRNGRVHLNRGGASVQLTTGSRGVRISGNNAGYTMFRGSVKGTGYPLHSPVSPSLPLPCVTVCHHISTGLYHSKPKNLRHNGPIINRSQ